MRKILTVLVLLAAGALSLAAQDFPRHEFRVGWGDMMFEQAAFRNSNEKTDYRHVGRFFAGYRYSFNNWLSAGGDIDYAAVLWNEAGRPNQHFFDLSFIPEVRFTYFRKGIVTMYGGLGFGLMINGGSETDYLGRKTICAPVLDLTLYGISVSWKRWFGAFELGGLNSANGKNEIFMAGSRLLSVSIGYRL